MGTFNLIIDSSKRLSGNSNDFVLKFNGNFPAISKVQLRWISLPLSSYTIVSQASTIYFNENATDKSAPIPAGYYTGCHGEFLKYRIWRIHNLSCYVLQFDLQIYLPFNKLLHASVVEIW